MSCRRAGCRRVVGAANEKSTSADVNGTPSENVTPSRSVQGVGEAVRRRVPASASHGSTASVARLRRTSGLGEERQQRRRRRWRRSSGCSCRLAAERGDRARRRVRRPRCRRRGGADAGTPPARQQRNEQQNRGVFEVVATLDLTGQLLGRSKKRCFIGISEGSGYPGAIRLGSANPLADRPAAGWACVGW